MGEPKLPPPAELLSERAKLTVQQIADKYGASAKMVHSVLKYAEVRSEGAAQITILQALKMRSVHDGERDHDTFAGRRIIIKCIDVEDAEFHVQAWQTIRKTRDHSLRLVVGRMVYADCTGAGCSRAE